MEIENVQRNFTRKTAVCKDLHYHQRLKKLGYIRSLQSRKLLYYKILNGKDYIRMEFKENSRRGIGSVAVVPPSNNKAQRSMGNCV